MYRILDNIESPADVKRLSIGELRQLCAEIRDYIVRCCSVNPGHLASSLGAVELIVGLHYVYDTPKDKLVFDVGHQAYAHKILTGRREAFLHNRQKGGLSGFPRREESVYDAFGAGHSSTSISAALGLAEAAKMRGTGEKVVALIGDGAITGGLAFEGLNNAGASKSDILIVLNDNNQSIDHNIGALHDYLLDITTDPRYIALKNKVWNRIGNSGFRKWLQSVTLTTKSYFVRRSGGALFEELGFRYFGPIDGNDIKEVVDALQRMHSLGGPRLLHVLTRKGNGYAPAENDPAVWHAPGKFDPETGKRLSPNYTADRYQDVFGASLTDLADRDPKIVAITPAMASGSGLNCYKAKHPDRFYDVGIEEEHAVTFSAGLAAGGMKPFCSIYSSFSQRAYDQIIHDVALQKLPVVLCFDRAGLVGEDGATHQGAFDMAAYRSIPDTVISAPRNETMLKNLLYSATMIKTGPYIIRYPRGCGEGVGWKESEYREIPVGKGEKLREGSGIAVLCLGPSTNRAVEAADALAQETGVSPAVWDMVFLKPLDEEILEEATSRCSRIITVEDGAMTGGLHDAVSSYVASRGLSIRVEGLGIPDKFIQQDSQKAQRAECGIDTEGILAEMRKILKN